MSGAAGLSAAKRRRAQPDYTKPRGTSSGGANLPGSRSVPKGQIDLNNPKAILSLHDKILRDHVNITNTHTAQLNSCMGEIHKLGKTVFRYASETQALIKKVQRLEQNVKMLTDNEKLREGHIDDGSPSEDEERPEKKRTTASPASRNVSFSVSETGQ